MITDNLTSSYDRVYQFIEKEIKEYGSEMPKLVHWLTDDEKNVAIQEFQKKPMPSISSINDPFTMDKINYPDPDIDYFHKKILKLKLQDGRKCLPIECFQTIFRAIF